LTESFAKQPQNTGKLVD